MQRGLQDRLDELLEPHADSLGGEGQRRGLGEAGDGLYVEDPGVVAGDDGVYAREAVAAQSPVGREGGLFEAADVRGGFEDGVWWVALASLTDPVLVQGAVARVP